MRVNSIDLSCNCASHTILNAIIYGSLCRSLFFFLWYSFSFLFHPMHFFASIVCDHIDHVLFLLSPWGFRYQLPLNAIAPHSFNRCRINWYLCRCESKAPQWKWDSWRRQRSTSKNVNIQSIWCSTAKSKSKSKEKKNKLNHIPNWTKRQCEWREK